MISPTPAKIGEILSSPAQFSVPRYQREYTWGKNEVEEFLDDLNSYSAGGQGNLFLGTIIFDVSEEDKKVIKIVDGQQRITTILLLLIACREVAKRINEVGIAAMIQQKIGFVDPTTAQSRDCRLIASQSIREVFDEISKNSWDGVTFPTKVGTKQVKRQTHKLKPIYDYFISQIGDFNQVRLSSFLETIYGSYLVKMEIKDEMEAFSIFERTNARGVDLEASDLLKNYLFAQGIEGLDEAWSEIVDNSDGTLLRMLKYFYVAKKGYVAKSELYKRIKAYGREGSETLVRELSEFSKYYQAIRLADEAGMKLYLESIGCNIVRNSQDRYERIHSALEGLRLFKVVQVYPLVFAGLSCFVRNIGEDNCASPNKLIQLFEVVEKYHFINTAICERMGNEVEKLYADFCIRYSESDNFNKTTDILVGELRKRLAPLDEFVSRFTEITYSQTSIALISYIFDRFNNLNLAPASKIKIYNSDQKYLKKNHNIEHFYPQKPSAEAGDDGVGDIIDNIGNLLPIGFKTNSRLGNLTPEQKMEKMKSGVIAREIDNLSYVQEFITTYGRDAGHWGKDSINRRAKNMATEAYSTVWLVD